MSSADGVKQACYTGNSMKGMFRPGDILILSETAFGKLKRGDVVAVFDRTPHYVHRVVETAPAYAVTMGDNNRAPDELRLTPESDFRLVTEVIPAGKQGKPHPVDGGAAGMKQFRRQQRARRIRVAAGKAAAPFRWLKNCRIPARQETRFRDGTVQWSCCGVAVAARNPEGKIRYLHWSKRLFFRVPQIAGRPADRAGNQTDNPITTGHSPEME